MPLYVRCGACRTKQRVSRWMAGRRIRCVQCGKHNRVPRREQAPTDVCSLVAIGRVSCEKCHTRIKITFEAPPNIAPAPGIVPPVRHARARLIALCAVCGTPQMVDAVYHLARRPARATPTEETADVFIPAMAGVAGPIVVPARRAAPPLPSAGTAEADGPASPTLPDPPPKAVSPPPPAVPDYSYPPPPPRMRPKDATPPSALASVGAASLAVSVLALLVWLNPDWLTAALVVSGLGLLLGVVGLIVDPMAGRGAGFAWGGFGLAAVVCLLSWFGVSLGGGYDLRVCRVADGAAPVVVGPDEWVDVRKGNLQQGRIRVSFERAAYWWSHNSKGVRAKKPQGMILSVRVENIGRGLTLNYATFSGLSPTDSTPMARLVDDTDHEYPLLSSNEAAAIRGRIREATLRPGYYAQDGLVFQPPPAKVRHLRLELAGEAVGLPEPFRFHIPRELIHFGGTW